MDPFQCDGEGGAELVPSEDLPPIEAACLQMAQWHPLSQAEMHYPAPC